MSNITKCVFSSKKTNVGEVLSSSKQTEIRGFTLKKQDDSRVDPQDDEFDVSDAVQFNPLQFWGIEWLEFDPNSTNYIRFA